ncbi:MAG: hypothetical protein JSV15_07315 [Candidatus Bathyarchaeota archaeon]|nr:MAG: hypothetical protein JSV15_07315 [Candidatus Bathyarchaeota archaeon]
MVEVVYEPWKKTVIHEVVRYALDDLVKLQSLGVEPGGLGDPLLWVGGIVFSSSTMLETKDVIKEKLEGAVHWSSVEWALMPEFKDVIVLKETNVKVPIIMSVHIPYTKQFQNGLKSKERVRIRITLHFFF